MSEIENSGHRKFELQALSRLHHLWWLTLFGILGLVFFFVFKDAVFPAASIEIKVPKSQILKIAKQWAGELGYSEQHTIDSVTFAHDGQAKTFLEYELGSSAANELMKQQIPVWFWSTRFCREFQPEYMRIYLSPDGRLASFYHAIENDKEIPSVSHSDAEKLAEAFIENKAGLSLSGYKLVIDESNSQIHRTDHSFVWEDNNHQWSGARLRTSAYVSGNQITRFNHYLYIPETWNRKFSTIRSYNSLLRNIAGVFSMFLATALAFIFFWALATHNIRWRFSLIAAGIMTLLYLLNCLNNFDQIIERYTSEGSFSAFLTSSFFATVAGAFGSFLSAVVQFGAAEIVYRSFFRRRVALENLFRLKALRTPQIIASLIAGHAAFGICLAWQVFYYLAGKHLGFWCPLEIQHYQVLGAAMPAFAATYIGIIAATSEEFLYRVIGLSVIQRLLNNFWIANLIQAAVWAFMHSDYPQQPAYARGLELTIEGLFLGWLLRRYGILACLVSHYLFDAMWGVMPLLSSPVVSLKISALIPMLPFLALIVFAFWLVLKYGVFKEHNILANASLQQIIIPVAKAQTKEETVPFSYKPLPKPTRMILVFLVIALLSLQFIFHNRAVVSKAQPLSVSREQAIRIASTYLLAQHYNPSGQFVTASVSQGIGGLQYVFEQVGFGKTNALALKLWQPFLWRVRFFKPLNPEEYNVAIDGQGRVVSFRLYEPEDAAGANLPEDKARELAKNFVLTLFPELAPLKFESVTQHIRPHRTDYSYTFTAPNFKVGQAEHKVTDTVLGDAVSGFTNDWNIPNKWTWARQKLSIKDEIMRPVLIVLNIIIAILFFRWLYGVFKTGAVRWRAALVGSAIACLTGALAALNAFPMFFSGYVTTVPLTTSIINNMIGYLVALLLLFSLETLLIAVSLACFRLFCPGISISSLFRLTLKQGPNNDRRAQRDLWVDGLLSGYAIFAVSGAVYTVWQITQRHISTDVQVESLYPVCQAANVFSPVIWALFEAISKGVTIVLLAPIIAGIYAKFFSKGFPAYLGTMLILSLFESSGVKTWQVYISVVIGQTLYFTLAWIWVVKLARKNVLAYFFCGYGSSLFWTAINLFRHGLPLYTQDFVLILLLLFFPVFYILYLQFVSVFEKMERQESASSPEEEAN